MSDWRCAALITAALGAAAGCKHDHDHDPTPQVPAAPPDAASGLTPRGLVQTALDDGTTLVDNGLDADGAQRFYTLSEGSELFPLRWFRNLEDDAGHPFTDDLARFGLLERHVAGAAWTMPVGLTADQPKGFPYQMIGVNCAACHVGEIDAGGGARLRIVGAPNFFDIQSFYDALIATTKSTLHDWRRLKKMLSATDAGVDDTAWIAGLVSADTRLGEKLGGGRGGAGDPIDVDRFIRGDDAAANKVLGDELSSIVGEEERQFAKDEATHPDLVITLVSGKPDPAPPKGDLPVLPGAGGGLGRDQLDAAKRTTLRGIREDIRLLIARIKFLEAVAKQPPGDTPPLYGRVDAFGFARNFLFGPIYKTYTVNHAPVSYPHLWGLHAHPWLHWNGNTTSVIARNIGQALGVGAIVDARFESTVQIEHLHELEDLAGKLTPPRWPAAFPPIDAALAAKGKTIYAATCAGCHDDASAEPPPIDKLGTDRRYLDEFAAPLATAPARVEFFASLQDFLGKVEDRYFEEHADEAPHRQEWDGGRPNTWRAPMTFAVRPLAGVWATAPYLHNNSVPDLASLLDPPAARPKRFVVGDRRYDPVRVGYVSTIESPLRPHTAIFDVTQPSVDDGHGNGNSNGGHAYGTTLAPDDKRALLEYLKTL